MGDGARAPAFGGRGSDYATQVSAAIKYLSDKYQDDAGCLAADKVQEDEGTFLHGPEEREGPTATAVSSKKKNKVQKEEETFLQGPEEEEGPAATTASSKKKKKGKKSAKEGR